jgi:hypothetical protein
MQQDFLSMKQHLGQILIMTKPDTDGFLFLIYCISQFGDGRFVF